MAVNVNEVRAAGGFYKHWKGPRPLVHPIHGDAAEERGLGSEIKFSGARVGGDEAFFFALVESVEFGAVDGIHGCGKTIFGMMGMGKGHP
jgi:hypothetical protein